MIPDAAPIRIKLYRQLKERQKMYGVYVIPHSLGFLQRPPAARA